MIIDEDEFFRTVLSNILQGRSNPFVLIASPRLADVCQEGELLLENTLLKAGVLHSTESGSHIARSALGHSGGRIYILYAGRNTFDKMADVAKHLRSQDPCGTIIVVCCKCDQERKRKIFANSIKVQEMDAVVFSSDCGAATFMYALIDRLKKYTFSPQDQPASLS